MYELHENEQYFFDEATLETLADFVSKWTSPCCICAPMLGKKLAQRGVDVTILDIDQRFATTKGFRRFDLISPEWIGEDFDLIVCDPPFFNVSLSQLFAAIRTLALFNFKQKLMISYLSRRSDAIVGTFAPFSLSPTNYFPKYQTVRDVERNKIEFFSNLDKTDLEQLDLEEA